MANAKKRKKGKRMRGGMGRMALALLWSHPATASLSIVDEIDVGGGGSAELKRTIRVGDPLEKDRLWDLLKLGRRPSGSARAYAIR